MSTKTLEKEFNKLKQEVVMLRSLVISIVKEPKKDSEGEYRPEFVKRVLKTMNEQPSFSYQGKGSLLKQLKQV